MRRRRMVSELSEMSELVSRGLKGGGFALDVISDIGLENGTNGTIFPWAEKGLSVGDVKCLLAWMLLCCCVVVLLYVWGKLVGMLGG